MKLIKPSYEIFEQGFEEQDIYKQIEKVGRTCYKSEDKITNESAKPFVDRMISSKHYAMLEHGTVYLYYTSNSIMQKDTTFQPHWKYKHNKYSKCNTISMQGTDCFGNPAPVQFYITTNLRVLVENNWLDDLQYLCEPTAFHERRICVKFTCDRGVSHEFVRHRVFSFAQESTRYCNYSKDKFGNELTFIEPCWNWQESSDTRDAFRGALMTSEVTYNKLIEIGWKAQEARAILPNSLKTELVMTGFVSDWKHFFDLRAYGVTGKPHPQASELAIPLLNEFITKGYLHGSERN